MILENELNRILTKGSVDLLLLFWHTRADGHEVLTAADYFRITEAFLQFGEFLWACDVSSAGLAKWPDHVGLRQLLGLAYARSGVTEKAKSVLLTLYQAGHRDEETLGLLARTYKDMWATSKDPNQCLQYLRNAVQIYTEAYATHGGYWTGINAATMQALLGNKSESQVLAKQVRTQCLEKLQFENSQSEKYWLVATLGEAALVLRVLPEAQEWYGQAAEAGRGRYGDFSSTRRNARLLLQKFEIDLTLIERWLPIPPVAVFIGHMIDRPDRPIPRFPESLEGAVSLAIKQCLSRLEPGWGYLSAACGSDILFSEALLERQSEAHIILPYDLQQFKRDSVNFHPEGTWGDRFEKVIAQATEIVVASQQKQALGAVSYQYGNSLLHGLAAIRASQLDTKLVPIAVWDGRGGDGPGGTASMVGCWRKLGYNVEIIGIPRGRADLVEETLSKRQPNKELNELKVAYLKNNLLRLEEGEKEPFIREIVALLFADVVGFSKLNEEVAPLFVKNFLGAIASLVEVSVVKPILTNTWGDGLFMVFSGVEEAGRFALDLRDYVNTTDWTAVGLPSEFSLRIALHVGPVYFFSDPITGRFNVIGVHVNRTACIEPVTAQGQVFASLAFAALAATENIFDFHCEYVGQTALAKGSGIIPLYLVRR